MVALVLLAAALYAPIRGAAAFSLRATHVKARARARVIRFMEYLWKRGPRRSVDSDAMAHERLRSAKFLPRDNFV